MLGFQKILHIFVSKFRNMKTKLIFILTIVVCCFYSCTENTRVKHFGGKQEISLKPHEKLMNITWKDADMWILTEDTLTHIKYFRESSSWGIWNGEIIIK